MGRRIKKFFAVFSIISILPILFASQDNARGEFEQARSEFANPDSYWAPHTFWFWNGQFTRNNIVAEASDMCGQRLNPGFVHVRAWPLYNGVWLSDKWFDLFGAALEETKERGMHMTYTIGGPSFSIGQLAEEIRARSLEWKIVDCKADTPLPECFFAVAAKRNAAGKIASLRKVEDSLMRAGESVFLFNIYKDVKSQYHNTFLDKRLFSFWKKFEHDKYEARFSKYFGNVMRLVFVDQEGDWGYKMAWSEDLSETFKKRNGYDITLALPLLIEEDADGKFMKARCDWFSAVGECYKESFIEPMNKWCAERSMKMTCHYWEGDLYQQAMMVGDYLGMQRASSVPGTDALFYTILTQPELFAETASVCAFEGRENMCELAGVAGWKLTPADLKDMGGAAVALGVTMPVLHGINTDRNLAHVSYPPDFYLNNPSWGVFHLWCDFMRRACHINRLGHADCSTLIFCPIESVWALTGGGVFDKNVLTKTPHHISVENIGSENARADEIKLIDSVYQNAQREMHFARVNFLNFDNHYFDLMQLEGGKLKYKDFVFDKIIIPETRVMRLSTARKLLKFAEGSGKIIALGSLPTASVENGANDSLMVEIFKKISESKNFTKSEIGKFSALLEPAVRFDKDAKNIFALRKKIGGKTFVWLSNASGKDFSAKMSASKNVSAFKWNCEDGTISAMPRDADGSVLLSLRQHEAFWISLEPSSKVQASSAELPKRAATDISSGWVVKMDFEKQIYTERAMSPINSELVKGKVLAKLVDWRELAMPFFSGTMDYYKTVDIPEPSGKETLVFENIRHTARVFVNGEFVGERMWAPFEFDIGKFLKRGKNEIRAEVSNTLLNELVSYKSYGFKQYDRKLPKADESEMASGIIGSAKILK